MNHSTDRSSTDNTDNKQHRIHKNCYGLVSHIQTKEVLHTESERFRFLKADNPPSDQLWFSPTGLTGLGAVMYK